MSVDDGRTERNSLRNTEWMTIFLASGIWCLTAKITGDAIGGVRVDRTVGRTRDENAKENQ